MIDRVNWLGGWVLVLASSSLLAGRSAPLHDARATVAQAPHSAEPKLASLTELHADPLAYLGRAVHFSVQLDAELTTWNPYLTRFGATDYRAWRTWGDDQFLWRTSDWEKPIGTLFVRRDAAVARELELAPRFARFDVVGRVRQVFLGRPWIEIERVERLVHEVDEASLLHAGRAMLLIDNERWPLAIEEIDRALAGDLPPHAREELWRVRGQCREHAPR